MDIYLFTLGLVRGFIRKFFAQLNIGLFFRHLLCLFRFFFFFFFNLSFPTTFLGSGIAFTSKVSIFYFIMPDVLRLCPIRVCVIIQTRWGPCNKTNG